MMEDYNLIAVLLNSDCTRRIVQSVYPISFQAGTTGDNHDWSNRHKFAKLQNNNLLIGRNNYILSLNVAT